VLSISEVSFRAFDVPLDEPFGIAGGTQHVAKNVLVEVRLADGTRGLGEAAPFPAVNGETQDDARHSRRPRVRCALSRPRCSTRSRDTTGSRSGRTSAAQRPSS
jgi:L-alanine-DL-glutamate epimerase-like enolase superfamily enzyme